MWSFHRFDISETIPVTPVVRLLGSRVLQRTLVSLLVAPVWAVYRPVRPKQAARQSPRVMVVVVIVPTLVVSNI